MTPSRRKANLRRAITSLRDRMARLQEDLDRTVDSFGDQSIAFAVLEARSFLERAISSMDKSEEPQPASGKTPAPSPARKAKAQD